MAIPLPILLIAGALGLKALSKRKPASSSKTVASSCSPKSFLQEKNIEKGGYPQAAADLMRSFLSDSAPLALRQEFNSASVLYKDLEVTLWDQDTGDEDLKMAQKQLRDTEGDRIQLAWDLADAFLQSKGCPIVPLEGQDLRQIIKDGPLWLRWVMAMGSFVAITTLLEVEGENAIEIAETFIIRHFGASVTPATPDSTSYNAEVESYTELISSLSVPMAGRVQQYEAKLDAMLPSTAQWLFPPIAVAEPFLVIEDRIKKLALDYAYFLTGQRIAFSLDSIQNLKSLESWAGQGMTPWLPQYMGLGPARTAEGLGVVFAYTRQMMYLDATAVPEVKVFEQFGVPSGVLHPVMARGRLDEQWWSRHDEKIKVCLEKGVELEEIALSLVAGNFWKHTALCDIPLSDLEKSYPSYDRWWGKNQGAEYDGYTKAIDDFKFKYPGIHLAIGNMMSMIAQKYDLADYGVDLGG